ncbi:hypothetical protein [Metallosphaera hakonensis]|uniref:Uncharacterized protein n=1 Tax=Metallosphaera hakonensis JCM 8857 = DSM 7519 TaxID=1293036 RepID=A0A2U9IS58_9CREN|nr:hypothetical protein [Metallosphaera hakonensis]AWR98881.1 hypothetical protein DFR87_03295 [Metallosphaera hakonensis JCM 8857 = DSM 7519]
MDFIELATRVGIEKDKAIYVYRRMNGGYYMKIYYSRSPILFHISKWPTLYLKSRKFYSRLAEPGYDQAVQLLITMDVVSVIGMSSVILNRPLQVQKARDDIKVAYDAIREEAIRNSIYPYPEEGEVKLTQDFFPFITDLVNKRREDDSRDQLEVLNDIAYDSEVMEETRRKYPWAKTVGRRDSLKALGLAGTLEEFLEKKKLELFYLVAQRTRYIDRLLVEGGITKTVRSLESPESDLDPEFLEIWEKLKQTVLEVSNYV